MPGLTRCLNPGRRLRTCQCKCENIQCWGTVALLSNSCYSDTVSHYIYLINLSKKSQMNTTDYTFALQCKAFFNSWQAGLPVKLCLLLLCRYSWCPFPMQILQKRVPHVYTEFCRPRFVTCTNDRLPLAYWFQLPYLYQHAPQCILACLLGYQWTTTILITPVIPSCYCKWCNTERTIAMFWDVHSSGIIW